MGIDSPVHLIFLGIVALLVLGPRRLPEMARALGHGLREFREAMDLEGEHPIEHPPVASQPVPDPAMPAPATGAAPGQSEADAAEAQELGEEGASPLAGQGDPLADSFARAQPARADVDPAAPIASPDAPDRRPL